MSPRAKSVTGRNERRSIRAKHPKRKKAAPSPSYTSTIWTHFYADSDEALADDPGYFLYHDTLGQGSHGTPCIDCDCSADSPFAVVYDHHMGDDTVFADLPKFIDPDYAREHEVIYVYTRSDNEQHELRVVAVDVVNANRETLRASFSDDEERDAYLNDSIARSDLMLDGGAFTGEALWAFATCSYQTSNSRTVVYVPMPQSTS